jgi:hypothetical protein
MNIVTNNTVQPLTRKEIKDLKVLLQFTAVYCRVKHSDDSAIITTSQPDLQKLPLQKYPVCPECREFLLYAFERRLRCPLAEKPLCKHCPVHCYKPEYRAKVREIMRFSGQYLIRRGRLDLLWHYFF